MVDYDTASGEGTLRIRDLGSVIEFWVQAGYSNFYWDGLEFNFTANGTTYPVDINYPSGAGWYKVGSATVNTTQTVYFRLLRATGTSSLAGPTTASRLIDRGSIPDPPTTPVLSAITSTSMLATFSDGDNGGLTIDSRQIAYNKSNTVTGATIVSSDKSTTLSPLTTGTTYYVWARTHNSKGYSGWSGVRTAKTLAVPAAPSAVTISAITQVSVHGVFTNNANNGAAITSNQLSRSVNSNFSGETITTVGTSFDLTGLIPGAKYYFRVRAINSVGPSAWSATSSATLIAGARLKVGAVWKNAVPYVRYNGVWKVATVYGKQGGYWKKSAT